MPQATALPQQPSWGHDLEIRDPRDWQRSARRIKVPDFAFALLARVGCLIGSRRRSVPIANGPLLLFFFEDREFDPLVLGLRQLLGEDLSGPGLSLRCSCRDCRTRESEVDHTKMPRRHPVADLEAELVVKEVTAKRRIVQHG